MAYSSARRGTANGDMGDAGTSAVAARAHRLPEASRRKRRSRDRCMWGLRPSAAGLPVFLGGFCTSDAAARPDYLSGRGISPRPRLPLVSIRLWMRRAKQGKRGRPRGRNPAQKRSEALGAAQMYYWQPSCGQIARWCENGALELCSCLGAMHGARRGRSDWSCATDPPPGSSPHTTMRRHSAKRRLRAADADATRDAGARRFRT